MNICYNAVMLITAFLFLLLGAILGFAAILITTFVGFVQTRVPYVRSKEVDTLEILKRIDLTRETRFYDLGSGDGTVLFLAEKLAGVQGTGFEVMLWAYWHALWKRRIQKSKARFYRQNFFKHSWAGADVLYCFLFPPLMKRVEKKFILESKPGAVLISRDFKLPTLKPEEEIVVNDLHTAFIYKK